jgi:uncharacterized protein involved in outer membrane biogenesis
MKRLFFALVAVLALATIGLVVAARTLLTGDNVRSAVASQLSQALGQPVRIGGLGASVYPRVTMDLKDVAIGEPASMTFAAVHLGTGLRGLLSRRIEGADVRVDGARVMLPLPSFAASSTAAPSTAGGGKPPIEIVSIDEIVLRDAEVVSGGRSLRGDIELVPRGAGVQVRRIVLAADGATVTLTGEVSALSPIAGDLDLKADALDVDRLVTFLNDFAAAALTGSAPIAVSSPATRTPPSPIGRLAVAMSVGKATAGGLTFSDFTGKAVITPGEVTFDPLTFGVFGGRYQGTMGLTLGDTPRFRWRASLVGVDAAALMAFAGASGSITGKLAGTIELNGEAAGVETALRTASGKARVDLTDGTIAGLQLVRTLVTASSGRGGILASAGQAVTASKTATGGERFSRLGATLRVADGALTTDDLAMASADVDLTASGTLRLADMSTDFGGRAQLSEALSREAGTDLYRYAQEGGRVTLPVTVAGPIQQLAVRVDIADAAKRAIRNRATEEINKALERNLPKGLGGLFSRKPKP